MWQKVRDWVDMLGLVLEMIPKYLRWYADRIEKWWAERGIATVNRGAPIPKPEWDPHATQELDPIDLPNREVADEEGMGR